MWETLKRLIHRKDLTQVQKDRMILDECLEEIADEIEPGAKTPQKPLSQEEFESILKRDFNKEDY